ncbi:MAG: DUF2490 domain-containing protein [Deltaproteobacteria bacterium]|nr:DUF2490 domain-containing protein [Myxococcales bacterium]MDP3219495.1 DUF2490 domain-containing protein [Deltaproteobacteria bacterium]
MLTRPLSLSRSLSRSLSLAATLLAASTLPRLAAAQEQRAVTHQYQSWFAVNFQGRVGGRFSLVGDAQYRAWDDFTPQTIIARTAVVFHFTDRLFAGVGYMWQPTWRARGPEGFIDEHRIYQVLQYEYAHAGSGLTVQLRTRFEQRFRHPTADVELGLRARQMVRAMLPITADRKLRLVAWDEVFLNLIDSGNAPRGLDAAGAPTRTPQWAFTGFDQNRAFLGLGYQFIPNLLRVELGYLNVYVRRPNNGGDLMSHIAQIQVFTGWR